MPGLNKHHDVNAQLALLIFNILDDAFVINMVAISPIRAAVINVDSNVAYPLSAFIRVGVRSRPGKIFLDFFFENVEKPVSFQVETFHLPGRVFNGDALANYYKKIVIEAATTAKRKAPSKLAPTVTSPDTFLKDLIEGIRDLLQSDIHSEAIRKHRETNQKDEAAFRNELTRWFRARWYQAEPEALKGDGRIDLKLYNGGTGLRKIIELKGWWNNDKSQIINQLCNYLTEFEQEGYLHDQSHQAIDCDTLPSLY